VIALISVSDKRGVVEFASALAGLGYAIVSTGNTARHLAAAGVAVRAVSTLTQFPEILDGRVKTLHPAVHGGILARRDDAGHMAQLAERQIAPIDLVVVNLYPFAATIEQPDVTDAVAIEQIDIGGPALLRAAAKNHQDVLVVIDPARYDEVLGALRDARVTPALRRTLAAAAFAHTAGYDARIARYLHADEPMPPDLTLSLPQAQQLRYGENPHQRAVLYGEFARYFASIHGRELSAINIMDIAAAAALLGEFDPADGATLTIVKHTNPCGVASAATPLQAWQAAFATDREAPFGGVIALNQPLDAPLARAIDEIFSEIVIAPSFTPEALDVLMRKKQRRLVRWLAPAPADALQYFSVPGGLLVQQADPAVADDPLQVVTRRAPSDEEWRALRFAWRVVKHVKSNAIVYAAADRTLGIGAGQMSRVDASRLAVSKAAHAGLTLRQAALGSDAFFPFADGVEVAAAAGATAVIQPGGSIRDDEVIAAADRLGLAMVFTGRRHFRH